MSLLWNRVPLESNYFSPLLQAIILNMPVIKKDSNKPTDLSNGP